MIKAIIIDDEMHCIRSLEALLSGLLESIELCGSFQNVTDGLSAIKKFNPQLVFLDVEIGNETGFDLLKQLTSINFEIIFTTAYDKYAVQAFKFSAIDYLLKPVEQYDLDSAIKKIEGKISAKESIKKYENLFYNLSHTSKRICITDITGSEFVQISDIIRCESDINYTTVFLKDKRKLLVSKTLKEFEGLLADYNFFRVHKSHLINLDLVKRYQKKSGGTVMMEDGSEVEVSTRKKDEFLQRLKLAW